MGWTYNTANPDAETNALTILGVGVALTSLSLCLVLLRLYVRVILVKAMGPDDWTIVPTWFMSLGFMIVTVLQSKWGLGLQHLDDMPTENIFNFGLLQYAGAPFYITSILGFKLSLLLAFLRIAVERAYRMTIIAIFVACIAFHLSFLLVQLNLCQPISKQWDPAVTWGSCLTAVPFYTSMASITILFDVIIILTPFPMLLKLQLPRRKKIVLLGIFSLGVFITVIQIIRILTIKSLANYIDSSELIMWSMVENNLGISIACIPCLAPLIKTLENKTTNRSTNPDTSFKGRKSAYALQSIGGGKSNKGFIGIGSGTDRSEGKETATSGVTGLRDFGSSSEELNWPPGGIHKTTSVIITRGSFNGDARYEQRDGYLHHAR